MQDKRKYERFTLRLRGKITRADWGDGEVLDVLTTDVSARGAFVHTTKYMAIGERVKLTLIVTSKKLKELTGAKGLMGAVGTVVRSSTEGMAICFSGEPELVPIVVS